MCDVIVLMPSTATLPFTERVLHYILGTFTDTFEPAKVLHHTAMKLIEARRKGTAKPKVRKRGREREGAQEGGRVEESGRRARERERREICYIYFVAR